MKKKKKPEEKRKHPRTKQSISFKIKIDDSIIATESIDLSCIGAYCQVDKYIPSMTNLRIVIALPCEDQEDGVEYIECNGVVVRVKRISSNNGFVKKSKYLCCRSHSISGRPGRCSGRGYG